MRTHRERCPECGRTGRAARAPSLTGAEKDTRTWRNLFSTRHSTLPRRVHRRCSMSHPQRRVLCGSAHDDALTVRFLGSELLLDEGYTRAAAAELLALARWCVQPRFVLDLGNVVALGSQALVLLLTLRRKLLATGRVVALSNPRPAVADVLAVTRLDPWFP